MKYCSDSVVKQRHKTEVIDLASPASHLITTKQFLEAFATGFESYEYTDLYAAANRILKLQMYQLYRLAKSSHSLKHKVKTSFVSQKFYDITPDNFEPTEEEVQLYLQKPKFIFRYSTWNLNAIWRIFEFSKLRTEFDMEVRTFDNDFSQIVPYLKPKYLINPKKNIFKHKKSNGIDYDYVTETFNKYFKYSFREHETIEYIFSDDFHIHGLNEKNTYPDFINAILTGSYQSMVDGKIEIINTNLNNTLLGIKLNEVSNLKKLSYDKDALNTFKKQLKEKKLIEKKIKKIDKQNASYSLRQYKKNYKIDMEAERKAKKTQSKIQITGDGLSNAIKNSFDSISSNSLGRIARKNALINRGVAIASETVDTIHKQAMKTVERSMVLKRKRSVIFGDETEDEVNAEYEEQSFLREYISEREPEIPFIQNGVYATTTIPDFDITDYVGTQIFENDHPISDHLTRFADGRRKFFPHDHPLYECNLWVGQLMKSENISFYSFIVDLLGESCAVENCEVACNFGHFDLREPWKLPVPLNRLEFIKKSYCSIVPQEFWTPALTFGYKNKLSEKSIEKIQKTLKSYIVDYRMVYNCIDDANKQMEIEKEIKRKARIAKIEEEKLKRIKNEKIRKANNEIIQRVIDHTIENLNHSYNGEEDDEEDENEERQEYQLTGRNFAHQEVAAQFNGLFNGNSTPIPENETVAAVTEVVDSDSSIPDAIVDSVHDIPNITPAPTSACSAFAPIATSTPAHINNTTFIPMITSTPIHTTETIPVEDKTINHKSLPRRLTRKITNKLARGISKTFQKKHRSPPQQPEDDDNSSIEVEYDSDIEREVLYQTKPMNLENIETKMEKENIKVDGKNSKIKNYTKEQIEVMKTVSQKTNLPKWSKVIDNSLPIKHILFKKGNNCVPPKLLLLNQREYDPRYRRFNKENHFRAKTKAIVDYSPFISRPEMTWCIIDSLNSNHVVHHYLQKMKDRFYNCYSVGMGVINRSNVNFRYPLQSDIFSIITNHNKNTPNFIDLRIIPFAYVSSEIQKETIEGVANYLKLFFTKHNRQSVIRPDNYEAELIETMMSNREYAEAIFTYARDCFLYEIDLAVRYVRFVKDHTDDNNEFLSDKYRVGAFGFFTFAFDLQYVPYYRMIDNSFNEVFDFTLGHYKTLEEDGYPHDQRWFAVDNDECSETGSDLAIIFPLKNNLDIMGNFDEKYEYWKEMDMHPPRMRR